MDTPTVVLSIFSSNQMDTPQTADSSIFKAPADVHRFSLARNGGTSSYHMMAGMFRFVCKNGMVCGNKMDDVRVPHKGKVVDEVIEGAIRVLNSFEEAEEQREGMKDLQLSDGAQQAFARAALVLRYEPTEATPAPITERQLLNPRRIEDRSPDLWTTLNRVQENMIRGGLRGRNATGRAMSTRAVTGIDQNVKLNRALWVLGEEMRKLIG
jgi:hypothetical protein